MNFWKTFRRVGIAILVLFALLVIGLTVIHPAPTGVPNRPLATHEPEKAAPVAPNTTGL
jgi:hypothetical protein